jgi:hypothetical protein
MNVPSSAELAAASEARRPKGKNRALDGVRLDTGTASNSGGSRPAKKIAGTAIKSGSGHSFFAGAACTHIEQHATAL